MASSTGRSPRGDPGDLPMPAVFSALVTCRNDKRQANIMAVRCAADTGELLAFLKFKDLERRFGEWVPITEIDAESCPNVTLPTSPLVWPKLFEPIQDEARKNFKTTLDFLEERLRRDMGCPNSFRFLLYLGHCMTPWYYSPLEVLYPTYVSTADTLHDVHLCPFTLTPFESRSRLHRHLAGRIAMCHRHTDWRGLQPPGTEVYCDPEAGLSLFEVDGSIHAPFCRNVFLVSKCYLENKLVGHDTDLYTFYVLAVHASKWAPSAMRLPSGFDPTVEPKYFAGYYSFENGSVVHNLACIVTLPCFQGAGFGRFLISASYAIGYKKGILGSPEKPLSDLGRAAYDKYWAERIWRWAGKKLKEAEADPMATVRPGHFDTQPEAVTGQQGGQGTTAFAAMYTSVDSISRALKLDASDVLETVLRLGLVHKADGKLKLVIPMDLARRQLSKSVSGRAPFKSTLLGPVAPLDGVGRGPPT